MVWIVWTVLIFDFVQEVNEAVNLNIEQLDEIIVLEQEETENTNRSLIREFREVKNIEIKIERRI